MLSTLCCMGQDLGGVPFEVFVQIPAQIVKPSQTLRELAGQIWPKPKLSNFVNQCTDWVHHWPLADISVCDCLQSGHYRVKLMPALFHCKYHWFCRFHSISYPQHLQECDLEKRPNSFSWQHCGNPSLRLSVARASQRLSHHHHHHNSIKDIFCVQWRSIKLWVGWACPSLSLDTFSMLWSPPWSQHSIKCVNRENHLFL